MVGTYHIFSEWQSLIGKTRSSQAVKRLLDLQPETARVVRSDKEVELPIEEVRIGDLVRIRPGERIPADGTEKAVVQGSICRWSPASRFRPKRPKAILLLVARSTGPAHLSWKLPSLVRAASSAR